MAFEWNIKVTILLPCSCYGTIWYPLVHRKRLQKLSVTCLRYQWQVSQDCSVVYVLAFQDLCFIFLQRKHVSHLTILLVVCTQEVCVIFYNFRMFARPDWCCILYNFCSSTIARMKPKPDDTDWWDTMRSVAHILTNGMVCTRPDHLSHKEPFNRALFHAYLCWELH